MPAVWLRGVAKKEVTGTPLTLIGARLKTSGPNFPLLPRIFAREKVPIAGKLAQPAQAWLRGRMRAGAPSALLLEQPKLMPQYTLCIGRIAAQVNC